MVANTLVDTGAILALLDRRDRWHVECTQVLRQLRLPLLTSEAVLTELFHLVGDGRREMEAAWRFLRSGAVTLARMEHSDLAQIESLMLRYWDCPMDFADASLVHLAARESIHTVFTVDRSDFETYRIGGKRRFQIVPAKLPHA